MDNKSVCAVAVLALMLSACGGGGGTTANSAAINAAVPVPLAAIQEQPALYESADVALAWTAPTQREDRSPLSFGEISGYQICYVGSDGQINLVDIPDKLQTDWVLSDLKPDNYQFNVFTYDVENNVSRPSATVELSIDTFSVL